MRRLFTLLATMAIAVGLALGLAACGDDGDDDATTEAATTPAVLSLTGESTTLALDEDTAAVLAQNDVAVAPVDPATAGDDGIAFPVTGGSVEAESLAGTIEHDGGLAFSAGGTDLELTEFIIDTEAGTLSALAGGERVTILDVDLSGLQRSDEDGTIVLEGITVALSADGADALNTTFGVDIFEQGLPMGDVTVRATA